MMKLSQIATAISAQHVGEDATFESVGADSRNIQAGQLFVALKGDNFDGHSFAGEAIAQGAAAVMCNADTQIDSARTAQPALIVKDTYAALGQLADFWRNQFTLPLIAVTGSNGKTTVKEMLTSILQAATKNTSENISENTSQVLATQGNLNNHIGMPMTLLKLRAEHKFAVIEMGMNHTGEIDYLTRIAKPNVAIINNAGNAHIGELGSLRAIAEAKGEIFAGLSENGTAVINADDDFVEYWKSLLAAQTRIKKIMTFGLKGAADVSATYTLQAGQSLIHLRTPQGSVEITLGAPGVHNVRNALAAAAGAFAVGATLENIKAGLEQYAGVKGRLQYLKGLQNTVVIDDTYNANPMSMKAAIDVLATSQGKKWLVLGDMGELGETAIAMHSEVGQYAAAANIDGLFTLGKMSVAMTEAFNQTNKTLGKAAKAKHFTSLESLHTTLTSIMQADSTVLVKGSRFMAMERVVQLLLPKANEKTKQAAQQQAEAH